MKRAHCCYKEDENDFVDAGLPFDETTCAVVNRSWQSFLTFLLAEARKEMMYKRRRKLVLKDFLALTKDLKCSDAAPRRLACLQNLLRPHNAIVTKSEDIDLKMILHRQRLVCRAPYIKAHWLSLRGEQPALINNPVHRNIIKELNDGPFIWNLSLESQIYYQTGSQNCISDDIDLRTQTLRNAASDPGINDLLPRFVTFIVEGTRCNILRGDTIVLVYLIQFMSAIVKNPNADMSPYLHQLVPVLLSCALCRQLNSNTFELTDDALRDDIEWKMRDHAACTIGMLVALYGRRVGSLEMKITQICYRILHNTESPYESLYGAMSIISELGPDHVFLHIFPLAKSMQSRMEQCIASQSLYSINAAMCYRKLVTILSEAYSQRSTGRISRKEDRELLCEMVGSAMAGLIEIKMEQTNSKQIEDSDTSPCRPAMDKSGVEDWSTKSSFSWTGGNKARFPTAEPLFSKTSTTNKSRIMLSCRRENES